MATVVVTFGGSDITDRVVFSGARFDSQVNGVAGICSFRVRDLDGVAAYGPGAEIILTIDGDPAWTGFATQVKRVYAFPALNLSEFGSGRFFDVVGSDINLLFTKRIVFNQDDPAVVLGTLFPVGTADTTAITELLDNWLDLSGDGLDTSSGVTGVGDITVAQPGRAWEGSDTWGQAMTSIARLPGAIFYLDPDRVLIYCDDETASAPFGLSDQPNGTTTRGYREFEVLYDGSQLANDVLGWGLGYGSQTPVFSRVTDATSVADHGLWQDSSVITGVYKQATLDYDTNSIVYGSPENLRGAKDDKLSVIATTVVPGLRAGQKVPFEAAAFGFSVTLPIRKVEIDFPNPTTPRYRLTMSYEIDAPFSVIDNFILPKLSLPPPLQFPPIFIGSACFIDTFVRPDQDGWGIATTHQPWTSDDPTVEQIVADHGQWTITDLGAFSNTSTYHVPPIGDLRATLRYGPTEYDALVFTTGQTFWALELFRPGSFGVWLIRDSGDAMRLHTDTDDYALDWATVDWEVHAIWDGMSLQASAWPVGDSEPGSWQVSGSPPSGNPTLGVQLSSVD